MSEPPFDPGAVGEPEKVDNTNAVHRALVEQAIADGTVDPTPVVEQMFTEGRLTAADVDAVVAKGWIGRKAAEGAIAAEVAAQETLPEAIKAVRAEPAEPKAAKG